MTSRFATSQSLASFVAISSAMLLGACGGGGQGGPAASDPATSGSLRIEQGLTGSVGDGPVVGATVRVLGNDGSAVAEFQSDANAGYNVTVRTERDNYPLTIEAQDGTDLVTNLPPDFVMRAAVLGPGTDAIANLTPFSTVAVELARNLNGGLNRENFDRAERIVTRQLNSGVTSLAGTGVMETPIDAANIAEIIRASETLGETIRRVRDLRIATGRSTTGDAVVQGIAADLVDGVVDGLGASGVDDRLAALVTVVSAQTALETMQNELHVYGVDATSAMEAAMNAVVPVGPTASFEDLVPTEEMLSAVRVGLEACLAIAPTAALSDLADAVETLSAGTPPGMIRAAIPGTYRETLGQAVIVVANANGAEIDTVNRIARDGGGAAGERNTAPTISGTPVAFVEEGIAFSFTPTATDPENDPLAFSISGRPDWATFDATTGTLSGTPGSGSAGQYPDIVIGVSDGQLSSELPAFTINVTEPDPTNTPPTISGSPSSTAEAGRWYAFQPDASDGDGDVLTFAISGLPAWASFNAETGRLSGRPEAEDAGTYADIVISASDGKTTSSLPAFAVTVTTSEPVNTPPTISGSPSSTADAGRWYKFEPDASDADGDALTFMISGRPGWAYFNAATGRLSGRPEVDDAGTYADIVISVSDGQASSSLRAFTMVVTTPDPTNTSPTISGSPSSTTEAGRWYRFDPDASDADGDSLTFTISGLPGWARFNASTGRLSGRPEVDDAGTYDDIVISVSDGKASSSLPAFVLTVTAPPPTNSPPTISGSPPRSVEVGSAYTFSPTAEDPDGDDLVFSISRRPAWATFDTSTGTLSGTPGSGSSGRYRDIVIRVSDGQLTSALPAFSINVTEPDPTNSPPTISGTPTSTVEAGRWYRFDPDASDADDDALTFAISGRPAWAGFNTSTGRLSGRPEADDAGTYADIVISVSDGKASSSLPAFSLTVTAPPPPGNSPPTISGSPPRSVEVGSAYSFSPTAEDPDGDDLVFSISRRPAWASFDTGTGTLSGTPAAGDENRYNNIVISVTDGEFTDALASFSIEVTSPDSAVDSVTLSWTAPTENEDGSALTDLAGYRVYWTRTPGGSTRSATIDNPSVTTYTVEGLQSGTYEFMCTSFNDEGVESTDSNRVSAVIP